MGYRAAFLLLLCVATVLPAVARAEAPPPAASASAPVTVDELDRLVDTLQNDSARAKLVADLRASIASERRVAGEKPAAVTFFCQLSQQIDALVQFLVQSGGGKKK